MRAALRALVACALLLGARAVARAEEPLPPSPKAHFNDYAGVVPAADAQRLDAKLADFERETSTQIVVAVFPKLPSPSLEDFTVRTAQAWGVGGKKYDNGAVLFVFVNDRKMKIETGYGLEGALPDQLAGRILDEQVRPRFRAGDWTGGLEAGIDGMIAATRGEYKAAPAKPAARSSGISILVLVVFVLIFVWLSSRGSRGALAHLRGPGLAARRRFLGWRRLGRRLGRRLVLRWRFGGGGGGGFSGGGGSFGGGGASSSW